MSVWHRVQSAPAVSPGRAAAGSCGLQAAQLGPRGVYVQLPAVAAGGGGAQTARSPVHTPRDQGYVVH